MSQTDALACVSDLKKILVSKGIWFTETIIHEPELKFIKIEASIKVK